MGSASASSADDVCNGGAAQYGLADVVVGRDPLAIETVWEAMREQVWWYGNSGESRHLPSARLMALWDLKASC
jgi:L-alanine-DL-glutamate epimerase-like enolase superfamily enzyme